MWGQTSRRRHRFHPYAGERSHIVGFRGLSHIVGFRVLICYTLSLVVVDHTASSITSRPAPVSCTSSSATTSCVPSASSPASSSSTRYEPWSPFRVALAHSSHTRSSPTLRDIIPFCVAQYIICYSSLTDSVTPRPISQSPMTISHHSSLLGGVMWRFVFSRCSDSYILASA